MRKALCCSILAALFLFLANPAVPALDKRSITQADLEGIIRNMDGIFQGLVTNVQTRVITFLELHGFGSNEQRTIITEVTIQIEKVIAGDYADKEITIILPEGKIGDSCVVLADYSPLQVAIGDRAIVGIIFSKRGTGYNILEDRRAFFKLEGGNLVPYQREYELAVDNPLEVIAEKAKEREMPEIFKAADLVCLGTITRLIDPASSAKEVIVSIDETLKGTSETRDIAVDVSTLNRSFKHQHPGYQALLFLVKDKSGYKPVAGVNGYYLVRGDSLFRGFAKPLRSSVSEMKSKIMAWKGAEK